MKKKILVMAVAVMAIGFTNICKAQNPDERTKTDNGKTPLTSIKKTDLDKKAQNPDERKKTKTLVTLYGYLHVYPSDIGIFSSEPVNAIAGINKSAGYGYDDWRLPTNEELEAMQSHRNQTGLRNEVYMIAGKSYSSGVRVRLVTTGNSIAEKETALKKNEVNEDIIPLTSIKKTDLDRNGLNGKVYSIRTIEYNVIEKFGEITKGNIYNYGDLIKYDAKGNQIEMNSYYSDGSLCSKYTFKYDAKGNQIEANGYKSDGSLYSKDTYKYDAKGNRIEENIYYSDGSLFYKYTYKYDDKGKQIEENRYGSDGSLVSKDTYKYRYDSKSNWIEAVEYKGEANKAVSIIEREIEYYE
ncbi:MAG: DUF1566 domain-containing protein [Prevotellaceae bacterium]|jgi:hypothetical protein|nr:DUF1566 domain-containing protein [Prevotellaceae bacterium]